MGELLKGLYDDLLEFDEERDKPNASLEKSNDQETLTMKPSIVPIQPSSARSATVEKSSVGVPRPVSRTPPPSLQREMEATSKVRYFIMKSNNSTNIDRSLASGVWSTQRHNETKLNNAFLDGFEVRLIFSINQSGHFQGYAIMKSAIGRGPKQNIWIGTAWGGFFEIDWQLQLDFPFSRFEHLSNPLNEGKPVKFARDGQEVPPDIGNEMIRIMQELARASGVGKPVILNQLKVEPYPIPNFPEDRSSTSHSRDFGPLRSREGISRRGNGQRWMEGYGRYNEYGGYNYAMNTTYSYASQWNSQPHYDQPSLMRYPRMNYGSWRPPIEDEARHGKFTHKRSRSPSQIAGTSDKRSLYEMSYEGYLQTYQKVQEKIREIMQSGELWKALGMIPDDYNWKEEDQKRIEESGWMDAWFGMIVGGSVGYDTASGLVSGQELEGFSNDWISEIDFVDFCRNFCGETMHFDEDKIKAYYAKMEALKGFVINNDKKARMY